MEYTSIGPLRVSRVCMGCMGFGDPEKGQHRWTLDADQSKEIIRAGLDAGINFFDTAIAYQGGTSERYVGAALRSLMKRGDVVVATKFLPRTAAEIEAGVSGREHVRAMLETSLANLGMDYVDLYILHMWDYGTSIEDTLQGLTDAVRAGKVRAVGISNCFAWQLAKANALAEARGLVKFVSVQSHYNLIAREDERELAPMCREEGIAMTPYSALAAGRLSRRPGETSERLEKDLYAKGKYDATAEADARIINRVAEIADGRGVSMTAVSLAWLMSKVTAPVVGATKISHIKGITDAAALTLTEEEKKYLEEMYVPHALVGVMAQNH